MQAKTARMISLSLLLSAGLILSTVSCKKNNSNSNSGNAGTVTADVAADAVAQAVSPESAGMVAQTETTVVIVNTNDLDCGTQKDTVFSGQNATGAAFTYSYSYSAGRLLTCKVDVPSTFQFDFSGKAAYSAARIASSDSAGGQFSVTGLEPGADNYVFNATYIRTGTQTSKVRNQLTFTSTINIQSTNLTIDKSTQQIVSGTATVSISGSASNGRSFTYSGVITFLGNKQATLVLGNGNTYSIIWN